MASAENKRPQTPFQSYEPEMVDTIEVVWWKNSIPRFPLDGRINDSRFRRAKSSVACHRSDVTCVKKWAGGGDKGDGATSKRLTVVVDGEEAESGAAADGVGDAGVVAGGRVGVGGADAADAGAGRRVLGHRRRRHKVVEARRVHVLVDVDDLDGQVRLAGQRRRAPVPRPHRQIEQLPLLKVQRTRQTYRT